MSPMPARRSGRLWRLAFVSLCCGSGLALAGTRMSWLEIFSHFQAYAAAAWAAAWLLFAASARVRAAFWRPRRAAALGALLTLAHAGLLAAPLLRAGLPALDREALELRIASFNMQHSNAALETLSRALARDPPDLVALIETTRETRLPGYEHVFHDRTHAIGLWSRHPLEDVEAVPVPGDRDQLRATVVVGRYRLPLLVVHWRIPLAPSQDRAAAASAQAAAASPHLLMIGDLNTTPWSPRMRRLEVEGGLSRSDRLGVRGTWAADAWHLLTLPIDHLLVKGDVRVEQVEFLPWTDSDHRALLARVACSNRR